ncbi:hypothetical protein PG985_010997 [Apiospora marii]|uniref:uncharacterized protein n=1 Tax=Apiospora marii TaxID=335849 RepID=UPI00312DE191
MFVTKTPNTSGPYNGLWFVQPTGWRLWEDFNYPLLSKIFKSEIETTFTGPAADKPVFMSRAMFNEKCLDRYIHKEIVEVVNKALDNVQPKGARFHIGEGSRCAANNKVRTATEAAGSRLRPDWSVVPGIEGTDTTKLSNVLLGDTKLHIKWSPNSKEADEKEWMKVLSQVTSYMAENNCRYGFIITEVYLVVLRLGYSSDEAQNPNDWHDRTFDKPEYCAIPWVTKTKYLSGDKTKPRLTAKLALFFLALLASRGRKIAKGYPPLDKWCLDATKGDGYHEPEPLESCFDDARDSVTVDDPSTEDSSFTSAVSDTLSDPLGIGKRLEEMSLEPKVQSKRAAIASDFAVRSSPGKTGSDGQDECEI